jgi:hypothetical protein
MSSVEAKAPSVVSLEVDSKTPSIASPTSTKSTEENEFILCLGCEAPLKVGEDCKICVQCDDQIHTSCVRDYCNQCGKPVCSGCVVTLSGHKFHNGRGICMNCIRVLLKKRCCNESMESLDGIWRGRCVQCNTRVCEHCTTTLETHNNRTYGPFCSDAKCHIASKKNRERSFGE